MRYAKTILMRRFLVMAMLSTGLLASLAVRAAAVVAALILAAVPGTPIQAQAADASPVFACLLKRGSVSVTSSGGQLTLRLAMPGKADTIVTGNAAQRTVLYRQDRYAGPESQLRFVSGRQSYIVYSMAGNRQTGANPVSGLSVLLDQTLQFDLACKPHAEFTVALSDFSLPEDTAEYSAMDLP